MEAQKIDHLWGHLYWLSVLAQQGSFTAAATRLGVSKAAMSQRMAELEKAAGVPLVQRTTRSVRLTEAGQRLVDDTFVSFQHIERSFSQVRDLAGAPRGLVRLTAPVALARQQLVPVLAEFLRLYPEVRLQLDLSDRLASMATEGYDLAIRHTASVPDTHVAWPLCATRSLLVASVAYLRRRGEPKEPGDLSQHNCLHYPRAHEAPAWTLERRSTGGLERVTVQIRGALSANNSEALRDAALADLGVALLPDFTAQLALRSGKVVQVLPGWSPVGSFAGQLYAIRPYAAHAPLAVQALVGHLKTALAAGFSVD